MKKFLIILAIIIVICGIAGAIYYFVSKPNQTIEITPSSEFPSENEGLPTSSETYPETSSPENQLSSGFTSLSSENNIFDYWLTSTGTIYQINSSGQIFESTETGSLDLIVSSEIVSLNEVQPSPDGSSIIVKFNYPNLPNFSILNITDKTWSPLPVDIISASWSPDSKQIAYLNSNKLALLNLKTKKTQDIIKLNQKDLKINWIRPNEILLYETPSSYLVSSIWIVDISKKTIKPFLQNERGLSVVWSKEADLGLKLTTNNSKAITLDLINSKGDTLKDFSFITLPDKCLIEQRKIYCGVPQAKPNPGISLPDDYYKRAIYFKDDIFMINLNDGSVTKLLNGDDQLVDAYRLSIQNNRLYFLNRFDNRLYSLGL